MELYNEELYREILMDAGIHDVVSGKDSELKTTILKDVAKLGCVWSNRVTGKRKDKRRQLRREATAYIERNLNDYYKDDEGQPVGFVQAWVISWIISYIIKWVVAKILENMIKD